VGKLNLERAYLSYAAVSFLVAGFDQISGHSSCLTHSFQHSDEENAICSPSNVKIAEDLTASSVALLNIAYMVTVLSSILVKSRHLAQKIPLHNPFAARPITPHFLSFESLE
jgi:hypothetical protein